MKKSKLQIVLEELKNAGDVGVHSFDLNTRANTIRSAARVMDLKEMGYDISAVPEKKGNTRGVRYFLNRKHPIQTNTVTQKVEKKPVRWEFRGNTAVPVYA